MVPIVEVIVVLIAAVAGYFLIDRYTKRPLNIVLGVALSAALILGFRLAGQ